MKNKKLEELKKQQNLKHSRNYNENKKKRPPSEQNKQIKLITMAEYQQKINEIDAQILAINQKYYKDTENLRRKVYQLLVLKKN